MEMHPQILISCETTRTRFQLSFRART